MHERIQAACYIIPPGIYPPIRSPSRLLPLRLGREALSREAAIGGGIVPAYPGHREVIAGADCVIGNGTYLDQVAPLLGGKEVIRSSMGKEVERARTAVELACSRSVTVVSGGDPGVYGMASLVLEVLERSGLDIPVEVVPGVTVATAAASRLGAPLSGDFVVASLSDLLTPWEEIERRLALAFRMGVPLGLYNPRSRGRRDPLAAALALAVAALLIYPTGTERSPFNPRSFDVAVEDVESDAATVALVDKGEDLPRVIWIIEDGKT